MNGFSTVVWSTLRVGIGGEGRQNIFSDQADTSDCNCELDSHGHWSEEPHNHEQTVF